ncbi:hypothetical protein [Shinella zoogloeoides]|uniref:hypothetical protein n=1 Tax=Shinella zoogloeoides TaxID=352475 RepID=UPI001E33899E|nr:hypothetical protein [Shinella zoogloeoides]UEX80418.1 hypothetical protein K8M09_12410 [Shinella zoogloeoides]
MYLIALDRNPAFVAKMKDDDFKSRHSRAALHLDAKTFSGTDDVRQQLQEFVDQGLQGAKAIQLGTLLEGSDFDRLYRSYRDISGDAAHVSVSVTDKPAPCCKILWRERSPSLTLLHSAIAESCA